VKGIMFSGNNSGRVFGRRKETIQDTRSREDYEDFSLNFFKNEIGRKYEFVFDFLRRRSAGAKPSQK